MKIRLALLSASLVFFACGEEIDEPYTLSTGTYAVSNAVLASQTDQCGLFGIYSDPTKQIGIMVTGTTVTFNLSNSASADPASLDKATLHDVHITQNTPTNFTWASFDDTCVVRITRTVTGELIGDDTASLTLDFSGVTEAGDCSVESPFAVVPCASKYRFTATRI
jgi:hypothetical protein